MAPGAKKKNANRRAGDNLADNKRGIKSNPDVKTADNQHLLNKSEAVVDHDISEKKKYSKRTVGNNWEKYEETPCDPHADSMRGKDFEVLLSYSGGSGSQLQLQDEKEWDDTGVDVKSIALDLNDLKHVIKSISFQNQINLSANVFTKEQLSIFESSAESWRSSYKLKSETLTHYKASVMDVIEPEHLDSNLNLIDNCDAEEVGEPVPSNSVLLEENTETIIESLAACLSLKTLPPEKVNDSVDETKKETQNVHDDLDFLLSLNVSLKNPLQEEKQSESKKTNVDDWLNSILDD